MNTRPLRILVLLACLLAPALASAITLRAAIESADPGEGYDRLVVLEQGVTYTGGLQIGPSLIPHTETLTDHLGYDVRIVGNGAILDLRGEQLCMSYCLNRLDIEDCIVLNGALRYRGLIDDGIDRRPRGTVRHVTFFNAHDYGIRLQRAGEGIVIENNLVVNTLSTGLDFIFLDGEPSPTLPTGACISLGFGAGGEPVIRDNWTYHDDPVDNSRLSRHYSLLCESG